MEGILSAIMLGLIGGAVFMGVVQFAVNLQKKGSKHTLISTF